MRDSQRACLRAALVLACGLGLIEGASAQTMLYEPFNYPDGVITNEYAFDNPTLANAHRSSVWEVTNGSMYAASGAGWTGVPDNKAPNHDSTSGNSSSAFRLRTIRKDFGSVAVSFRLLNLGLNSSSTTPPVDWDGAHVQMRYVSEYQLYALSVNRRDNKLVIKKKVPGGPSNGGTYYDLTPGIPYTVPYGQWQTVKVVALNNADGSVTLELWLNGTRRAQVIDDGRVGGSPIRTAGRVGLRGDNANLKFDDFIVTSLTGSAGDTTAPTISGVGSTNVRSTSAEVFWTTNEAADTQLEYGLTNAYGTFLPLDTVKATSHRVALTGLLAGRTYYYRPRSRDAAGNLRVGDGLTHGFTTPAGTGDTTAPTISGVGSTSVGTGSADIIWNTNEAADSQVEYGFTTAYGTFSTLHTTKVTGHRVTITGLQAGRRYYYRVRSRDASGNLRVGDGLTHGFVTKSSGDTTPPVVLSAGSTNVKAASADIVWTTNEPSDSQVEFGLTSAYGSLSYLGTARVTSHKISLSNLRSGTRYYYRVRSRDASGNLRVDTVVHAFTTPSLTASN